MRPDQLARDDGLRGRLAEGADRPRRAPPLGRGDGGYAVRHAVDDAGRGVEQPPGHGAVALPVVGQQPAGHQVPAGRVLRDPDDRHRHRLGLGKLELDVAGARRGAGRERDRHAADRDVDEPAVDTVHGDRGRDRHPVGVASRGGVVGVGDPAGAEDQHDVGDASHAPDAIVEAALVRHGTQPRTPAAAYTRAPVTTDDQHQEHAGDPAANALVGAGLRGDLESQRAPGEQPPQARDPDRDAEDAQRESGAPVQMCPGTGAWFPTCGSGTSP